MEPNSEHLFFNAASFSEDYVVPLMQGREPQLAKLRACVAPVFRGAKPSHALLVGPAGSGKTLAARMVLGELKAKGIMTVYVNCMQHSTMYGVLDKIIADHRILRSERISAAYKLEQIERFLANRPCVVVLDEIDKMPPKERRQVLYNLSVLGKVGLVCLCSNPLFLQSLEPSVSSRLAATKLEFPPYEIHELRAIVRQRAELGLVTDCCSEEVIAALARSSGGDARAAVQVLRQAAVSAGQRGSPAVEVHDINSTFQDGADLKRAYVLSLLSEPHRILLRSLEQYGELTSVRLAQEYEAECVRLKLKPMADRTFLYAVNRLAGLGLVEIRKTTGNTRVLRFVPVHQPNDDAA